jgi:hypothetical protein
MHREEEREREIATEKLWTADLDRTHVLHAHKLSDLPNWYVSQMDLPERTHTYTRTHTHKCPRAPSSTTRDRDAEMEKWMRRAEEEPYNIEVQRKIEEIIQQKNIQESYADAMEHNPEMVVGQASGWGAAAAAVLIPPASAAAAAAAAAADPTCCLCCCRCFFCCCWDRAWLCPRRRLEKALSVAASRGGRQWFCRL